MFCALLLAFAPAFAQPLSPAAWQEDLDFLVRELPAHHKNLFYRLTREQFQKEVADIREKIPTWSEPPDPRGPPAIARIRGQCPHHDQRNRRGAVLPIRFEHFPDGLYVVAATADNRDALGAR